MLVDAERHTVEGFHGSLPIGRKLGDRGCRIKSTAAGEFEKQHFGAGDLTAERGGGYACMALAGGITPLDEAARGLEGSAALADGGEGVGVVVFVGARQQVRKILFETRAEGCPGILFRLIRQL